MRGLFVGPAVLPQKINFSSDMLRKVICSLIGTELVFVFLVMCPFHPPIVLVSILKEALSRNSKNRSGAEIFRPVSIRTSNRVGVIEP